VEGKNIIVPSFFGDKEKVLFRGCPMMSLYTNSKQEALGLLECLTKGISFSFSEEYGILYQTTKEKTPV
tara:strand:+ start:203 stop:409 length:207 start_codon:yes stop_codon:yes gene_type:complete